MITIRGIHRRIYPNLIKENRRMSTRNRLGLQTLGSQSIMLKNLPNHWNKWSVWNHGRPCTKIRAMALHQKLHRCLRRRCYDAIVLAELNVNQKVCSIVV